MKNRGVKNFSNVNFDFGRSNVESIVKLLHVSKQYSINKEGEKFSVNRHKKKLKVVFV